jgi:KaiC/GvpD/RAD55 family RecA-like ATPase
VANNKDPSKLFDEFWYEGETCCLFADSNVGKSILAVQIARDIAETKKVLYFDFELNEYHFKRRYTDDNTGELHKFSPNLFRVSLDYMMGAFGVDELPDQIISNIEKSVKETKASVVIIDNLTWIAYNSGSSKMASVLMQRLAAIKAQYNLSMLILAHTPKRNMTKPITQNDLGGSKMLMNFLDSAFAIGCSSKDPAIRYLKQVKVRYAEMKYGEDNIWLCTIDKVRSFLTFRRLGFGMESDHLKKRKNEDKQATIAKIKAMRSAGATLREIADELGMTVPTVDRWSKM